MAITIKHGVNTLNMDDLAGQTVEEIRERFEDALNLGENDQARINGAPAAAEDAVQDGQTLEVVKVAGDKGALDAA